MSKTGLSKTELTKKLNELLDDANKEGFVLSLNGEWGIGKTVFWKDYSQENLTKTDKEKVAYISLFGKDSLEAINSTILLEISKKQESFKLLKGLGQKYSAALGAINNLTYGIGGVLGSALLSALDDDFFENKIICFDDFERISDKLSHKDVMGLISNLKEDKKCKIVMIMHQDKIGNDTNILQSYDINSTHIDDNKNVNLNFSTKNNNEFNEYKEKLVDIELFYSPSIEDLYSLVESRLKHKDFKSYMLKYLIDKNIKNIRVMKRIIRALNDFSFILEWEFLDKEVKQEIIENILEISAVYSRFHFSDFNALSKYTVDKALSTLKHIEVEKKFSTKVLYEEVLEYIYYRIEYRVTPITEVVVEYIKTNIIDTEKIEYVAKEKSNIQGSSNLKDTIHTLQNDYSFNLQYKNEDFSKQIYKLFYENKKNIINIVNPENFIFYIEQLKTIDEENIDRYDKLAIIVAKIYIANFLTKNTDYKSYFYKDLNFIKEKIEGLDIYADKFYSKLIKSKVSDINNIRTALKDINGNKYKKRTIDILASLSKDECKKYILQDAEITESIYYFLRHTNIDGLDEFKKMSINVLTEIGNENSEMKYRIDRIFKLINNR